MSPTYLKFAYIRNTWHFHSLATFMRYRTTIYKSCRWLNIWKSGTTLNNLICTFAQKCLCVNVHFIWWHIYQQQDIVSLRNVANWYSMTCNNLCAKISICWRFQWFETEKLVANPYFIKCLEQTIIWWRNVWSVTHVKSDPKPN